MNKKSKFKKSNLDQKKEGRPNSRRQAASERLILLHILENVVCYVINNSIDYTNEI